MDGFLEISYIFSCSVLPNTFEQLLLADIRIDLYNHSFEWIQNIYMSCRFRNRAFINYFLIKNLLICQSTKK